MGHSRVNYLVQSLAFLERRDRRKLIAIGLTQILMGFLDLAGITALGVLGALAVQGVESKHPGNKVLFFLKLFHMQNLSLQSQVAFLGIFASLTLILKTILSMFFTRRIFFFLSFKSANISANLVERVLSMSLLDLKQRSTQEILYIVTTGVNGIMNGVIATTINIFSDTTLILILSSGLFVIDPIIAFATLTIFGFIGFLIYKFLHVRSRQIGVDNSALTIQSAEKILEALNSYRETVVRNRQHFYSSQIKDLRFSLGSLTAELNFQPYIGKYIIEGVTVIGSLLLAAYEFTTKDAVHATAVLAIFIAASSRIAPAVLRLQQGFTSINNNYGTVLSTFALASELDFRPTPASLTLENDLDFGFDGFVPIVKVEDVQFSYSNSGKFSVNGATFTLKAGTLNAIVGPSGAGKTTIVDLILGVLKQSRGVILISGMRPDEISKIWSGVMSYVPQDVIIASGTIRENVSLGYPRELATDKRIWSALRSAQLEKTVRDLPGGLDFFVGEHGANLSGGQRQRLGIARALFTSPKLLILDEATSALDGQTEKEIINSIASLRGQVTVLVVAHRLATVRMVDQLIYMDQGKIVDIGSFDEVRARVPDFDSQAKLMGL